jgi:zinc protease
MSRLPFTILLTLALPMAAAAQAQAPSSPSQAAAPQAVSPPDRSRPPAPGPTPSFTMPPVARRALSNGVPVWVVERHDVPVVQVNLVVRAGATDDPAGKPGVASLVSAMLDEGAGTRSALELADAIEFLGADLGAGASMDASAVRLHVPVARLREALALMSDVALRPTFPPDELERVRKQRLTTLLQARDEPDAIADIAILREIYGPTARYGTLEIGTAASLRAIGADDLRRFHQEFFRPERSVLIVAGDVTADAVVPLLEQAFGSWTAQGSAPAPAATPVARAAPRREIVLVDKPGAAQSEIRIGRVGVPRSTPDYFAITVMNTLLGGSFTSRLNQNLRETHGFAYGAGSGFDMRLGAGPFIAQAAVQTDKTAEALREFFNEFAWMRKAIPRDDLAKTRNYVALRFPEQFMTTRQIAGRLEGQFVYGLPPDYYSGYVAKLLAVSDADVAAAAAKYITPDDFVVVVVGDRAQVEAPLRALNLGSVRVASIDQFMGPLE